MLVSQPWALRRACKPCPNNTTTRPTHCLLPAATSPPSRQVEYNDILTAAQVANEVSMAQSFKALFSRKYSPMTIVTGSLAMLQQLTGSELVARGCSRVGLDGISWYRPRQQQLLLAHACAAARATGAIGAL